jgi:hypothetical protein
MTTIRTLCLAAAMVLGAASLAAAADAKPAASFTIYGTDDCREFGADLVATGSVYALQGKTSPGEADDKAVLVGFPASGTCWTKPPTVPKAHHPEHADKPVRSYVPIGACAVCVGFAAQR